MCVHDDIGRDGSLHSYSLFLSFSKIDLRPQLLMRVSLWAQQSNQDDYEFLRYLEQVLVVAVHARACGIGKARKRHGQHARMSW